MKRLQPVIWMKGTFLSPQYLQTQDRFIESTLEFYMGALSFAPWGFKRLQINLDALDAGSFAITDAAGIFPDGLIFDIPDSDPPPSPKPLVFEADENAMDVFLAIPHYRDRGLNVSIEQKKADTRFLAEVAMLRDENSGLTEKPVQVARKNFRTLVEGESQQHVSILRIARVLRTPAGTCELDPNFVPPLLDITASDYLVSIARNLVGILTSKSTLLSSNRRQKNLNLAEFGTSDIANFWLLYTINCHLPLMRHIFETRHGHPSELFETMLSLGGCLTTFSMKIHPRDLPKYEHDDLYGCFHDLDEKVRFLLDTVVPSNFVSLPLKLLSPAIYGTALADDKYLRNTRMYLAMSVEMNEGELIGKAPHLIKVCSANEIEVLVKRALHGVQLTHAPKPPSAIPVKVQYQYFSLNQSGGAWEAIVRARNFAAFVPGDFPNPKMELVILLPEE